MKEVEVKHKKTEELGKMGTNLKWPTLLNTVALDNQELKLLKGSR